MRKLKQLWPYMAICGLVCLFFPVRGFAQGGAYQSQTFGPMGTPRGGVTVTVCATTSPVVGGVCTVPEVDANCCFTDGTLTVHLPNPFTSDGLGNLTFWASPGLYKVSYSGAGVTPTTLTVPISCVPGATACTGLGAQLNVPNTFTAANIFPTIDQIRFVDGTTNLTPQAAIASCPSAPLPDCWVVVPPNTPYPFPNNVRSHLHIMGHLPGIPAATITAATNLVWGTPPADNKVIFTSATGATLSNLWDTTIENVTLDCLGNNVNCLVLGSGVFNNTFDIVIQNAGTGTGLTMNSGIISGSSSVGNIFRNLYIFNAGKGIVLNGSLPGVVANNRFMYTFINNISIRAIEIAAAADTNSFDMTFIGGLGNSAQALAFNTGSPAADIGCNDNVFRHLITDVFTGGSYTGTLIQINKSFGNTISAWSVGGGVTTGGGVELATSNSPGYSITYASDFSLPGNNNTTIIGGNIQLNGVLRNYTGTSTMGMTPKRGSGAGNYTSASTSYVAVDGTNLAFTVTIPTGWKLSVVASGDITVATAAVAVGVGLADGGVLLPGTERVITPAAVGVVGSDFSTSAVITGDGASHTIDLRYKTSNGADSVTIANVSSTAAPSMVFTLMPSN